MPHTGLQQEHLPQELGFVSGTTCSRRSRDGNETGIRQRSHEVLPAEPNTASRLNWSHCTTATSHVPQTRKITAGPPGLA